MPFEQEYVQFGRNYPFVLKLVCRNVLWLFYKV